MQTGNWEKIEDGGITAVAGIKAAGVHCGLKKEQKDLAVIYSAYPAAAAGAFTRNLVQAAPCSCAAGTWTSPCRPQW